MLGVLMEGRRVLVDEVVVGSLDVLVVFGVRRLLGRVVGELPWLGWHAGMNVGVILRPAKWLEVVSEWKAVVGVAAVVVENSERQVVSVAIPHGQAGLLLSPVCTKCSSRAAKGRSSIALAPRPPDRTRTAGCRARGRAVQRVPLHVNRVHNV